MSIVDFFKNKKAKEKSLGNGKFLSEKELNKKFANYPTSSTKLGYKIPPQIITQDILAKFLPYDLFKDVVDRNNNIGFVSCEIGQKLESLMYNQSGERTNLNIYLKTSISNARESIFEQGIRCLGAKCMGLTTQTPKEIKDVTLEHTVERFDTFVNLIGKIKSNEQISQGNNYVDENLVLAIPNNLEKQDFLYHNEETNTINIKPEFIVGSIPINQESNITEMFLREDYIASCEPNE